MNGTDEFFSCLCIKDHYCMLYLVFLTSVGNTETPLLYSFKVRWLILLDWLKM